MNATGGWLILVAGAALGCKGDAPPIASGSPPDPLGAGVVRVSELIAGPEKTRLELRNPYEGQENVLTDGKRYYNWFNCTGCHGGAGGGGIGPPLADNDWIYGGQPANIFLSIVQGRPYGMPSYGGQIPDDQVWKIVAYVTSLAGTAGPKGTTADETGNEDKESGRGVLEGAEGGSDR
jgi:cytochrome c oxidase cbb3-type subunit III